MRTSWVLCLGLLIFPAAAQAQSSPSVSVQFAGGPTLYDKGHNLSGAVGFSPASWITLFANVDRTHLPTQTNVYENGYSRFRGGTLTSVSGEARVSILPRHRVSPFVSIGMGAGTSEPNVNEFFPHPVKNDTRFMTFGAGVTTPLGSHLSLFGDARIMIGSEGIEGMMGVAPVRAGVAWRF